MYTDPNPKVEEKRAEIRNELMNNKALWEHYAEYKEKDVESLIDKYALTKARLKVLGNYTRRHHEKLIKEWTARAWFALCEIQHKKLFDMQCRWRAGEIEQLPGIRWTYDFSNLEHPILDMDLLPDITPEEVEEYIRFLKTPQGEVWINYGLSEHQSYNLVKQAHFEDKGFMPDYYDYHYMLHGNTNLLALPDIRDENEQRLFKLIGEFGKAHSQAKKQADTQKTEAKTPEKKFLNTFSDEAELALAEFLGEKDVAGFIKDLGKWVKEKPEIETDWAMDYLACCYPENVPMPAAPRWQDALEQAALQHITLKVQETLPVVYQEYLMKKELNTPIGDVGKEKRNHTFRNPMIRLLEIAERIEKGENVDPDELWKGLV